MTSEEAHAVRSELWASLKALLIRTLGRDGAAEWLEFAAGQMRLDAARHANARPTNVVEMRR